MNIPVILYGDDGSLLNRIESQRGRVSVARTVQDFSEAVGMAHTGIARVLLCAHVPAEMSVSTVDALAASEVLLGLSPRTICRCPRRRTASAPKLLSKRFWVRSNKRWMRCSPDP